MVFLAFQQALSMLKGKVCRYIGTTIVDREASGVQLLQDLTLTFFVSLVFLGPGTIPPPGAEQSGCSAQV